MPAKKTTIKSTTKKAPVKKESVKRVTAKKSADPKVSSLSSNPVPMAVDRSSAMSMNSSPSRLDSKKLLKLLVVVLVLGLVYLLKDEVIVATVNGKPVTRWELVRNLEQQSAPTVLENITLKMLVEQELKKAGIEVSDAEMDEELKKIEDQLSAQGQNLDDLLKAQGLSRSEVKEQLALSKGLEKLLADRVTITDEEVTAYFEENKEFMGDVALEDVKADVEAQLRQQKLSEEQQKWFAEIKESANINYYKFAPSTNL